MREIKPNDSDLEAGFLTLQPVTMVLSFLELKQKLL